MNLSAAQQFWIKHGLIDPQAYIPRRDRISFWVITGLICFLVVLTGLILYVAKHSGAHASESHPWRSLFFSFVGAASYSIVSEKLRKWNPLDASGRRKRWGQASLVFLIVLVGKALIGKGSDGRLTWAEFAPIMIFAELWLLGHIVYLQLLWHMPMPGDSA